VRLRPMPPTAPAAPVTRIGLSCLWFAVMAVTLGYFKRRTGAAARWQQASMQLLHRVL
jgi:hypothetical protein